MTDFLDLAARVALAVAIAVAVGVGGYRAHEAMMRRSDRIRTGRRPDIDGGGWV